MGDQELARILVPLDGSARAEGAVPYAINIAIGTGAELMFVVVLPRETEWPQIDMEQSLIRAEVAARAVSRVSRVVQIGDPMVEIVGLADEKAADLIVMSTRGLTGRTRRKLGSVVARVLLTSPVPVFAVRTENRAKNISIERRVEHLIVPVDGSNRTHEVEALTFLLAVSMQARVTILHVRAGEESDMSAAGELLDVLVEKNVQVDIVIQDGDPATKIRNFAALDPNSVVVMCSRGPQNRQEHVMGSVADFVIRHSQTPVVVVPPVVEEVELREEPDYLP